MICFVHVVTRPIVLKLRLLLTIMNLFELPYLVNWYKLANLVIILLT